MAPKTKLKSIPTTLKNQLTEKKKVSLGPCTYWQPFKSAILRYEKCYREGVGAGGISY